MPDDFSDTTLTSGAITPGTSVTGEIEVIGDADWFEVTLIAGRIYAIEMRGADTADGTLADPEFAGVFLSDGTAAVGTGNGDASADTTNSATTFYAPYSGVYYLSATGLTGTGTYTLEITDLLNSVSGAAPDDLIVGTEADDTLLGLAGNDTIYGLGGDDLIEGGDNDDSIIGGLGADTILGGSGNDTIVSSNGPDPDHDGAILGVAEDDLSITDVIYGGDGDDLINMGDDLPAGNNSITYGEAGNDSITGRGAVQYIDGGTGADYMQGSGGATIYIVDNFGDQTIELSSDVMGPGNTATGDIDEVRSSISWTLLPWNEAGGANQIENLTLIEGGNASATGNEVGNVIIGNTGSNRINGMGGDDTLTGGGSADIFQFSPGGGHDIITDFQVGIDQFGTVGFGSAPTVVETVDADGYRVFTFDGDTSVTLLGVFANRAPEFTSVPPLTINEDELFTYRVTADDPDDDNLSFVSSSWPSWLTPVGGVLTGTPTQENVGTEGNSFSFVISDPGGLTATQEFVIEVLNVNDDPVFDTSPILTGTESSAYSYTPTFNDEDGDIPTIDMANTLLPDWLTIDPATGALSGTPTQADVGTHAINIAISDGNGGTAVQTFELTIEAVNDPPVAQDDTATGTEDAVLVIADLLGNDSDAEGDPLSIQSVSQGAHGDVALNADGTVSYTPDPDFSGTDTFTYTVADDTGGTDTANVTVTIENENDAPAGDIRISGAAIVGQTLTVDLSQLSDPDGIDSATMTYQWLRNGAEIAGATASTFNLSDADIDATLSVSLSYTDEGGTAEAVTSLGTGPVAAEATPVTGTLAITGTAGLFQVLQVSKDQLNDPDGLALQSESYQWLSDGQPITGATGPVLEITPELMGRDITVQLQYVDSTGTEATLASAPLAIPDPIIGTEAADQMTGTSGNDLIDGLDDHDTLAFTANRASYSITLSQQGIIVDDRRTDGDGTDQIANIETLAFLDNDWPLDVFSDVTTLSQAEFSTFIEMYIAYFNRAPDAEGLFFWANALSNGTSLEEIAALFFDQDETRSIYGEEITDLQGFAQQVYQNVLGRAFDQEGLDFWVSVLQSGAVALPTFMLEIIRGAKAPAAEDASQAFKDQKAADVAYLSNKADLGTYFSAIKGMSDVENARAAMTLFNGSADSITTAKNAIDGYYADALDAQNGEFLISVVGVVDDPFAA
jgi:Ca2+-binding RTX toxin-like protein